ncbi:MAG: hypothetical protein IJ563_09920 [Selenomonadaceae bacterium]|nr:hypothetical protein [Selenomonadaceae bacterium]
MKKLFLTMMLTVALIVVGAQTNKAEAYELYVGTYTDGYDVYLLTETVNGENARFFKCTVRAKKGNDIAYIDYNFAYGRGFHFKTSTDATWKDVYGSKIASNIHEYARSILPE